MGFRISLVLVLLVMGLSGSAGQRPDPLDDAEETKVREAQDPSDRIVVYCELAQKRLDRLEEFRSRPMDPAYDNGGYINRLLQEYVALTEELKSWIEDRYERRVDMRWGLQKFLGVGPRQLEQLRQIEGSKNPDPAEYASVLRDAEDDLKDALDGATKALGEQVKAMGEMKRQEKVSVQAAKVLAKDEKKRTKEEEKLRKQQRKQQKKQNPTVGEDQD
jgi:hypothetical protein